MDDEPNNSTVGWDGNLKGRPMNPAVLVYWSEIEFDDGQVLFYEGDVSLVR